MVLKLFSRAKRILARCSTSRAACAFACGVTLWISHGAQAFLDAPVYTNALAGGWQNWSWGTTVSFNNASPAVPPGGASIAATYTQAWAGLYLHTDGALNSADYTKLRFSLHGGSAGGQDLQVYAVNSALQSGPTVNVASPSAGTWTVMEIPIANLGLTNIGGIVWQDTSGNAGGQPTFYLDEISLIASGGGPLPGVGPALAVNATTGPGGGAPRAISEYIYGMNFASSQLANDLRLPVRRWGGNATTRYNYLLDTSNRAMDWYYENIPNDNPNPGALPVGSASDKFVDQDRSTPGGTKTIMTLPLIGWTPKARQMNWGFSVIKYGAQQQTDPWQRDAGNGVKTNGQNVIGNDPLDTSIAITPAFVQGWIAHLISRYGNAASGGVMFYNLDNEPMLWNDTHRDVHPQPTSYNEMRDRTYQYGAAIKQADPTCKTLGPAEWGWTGYFYSALDWAPGGSWWNNPLDRLAHGNTPFVEWYLQQMKQYEITNGVRILDYLDLHYYPQANGVSLTTAGGAATQALRLRSTRSLWDPTYVDESWIGEAVRLIPRMKDWVNTHYPGTKTAITEYNWGGHEHISGALAQADVLGIFGREGLDLATLWDPPEFGEPCAFAFRMYRNYDGSESRFGQTAVNATSADQAKVSVYAAKRTGSGGDGALTVIFINKDVQDLTSALTISNFGLNAQSTADAFRYSGANLSQIVTLADVAMPNGNVNIALPASSITLLVVPNPAPPCEGDTNGSGAVDIDDLLMVIGAWGWTGVPGSVSGDVTGDGAVNIDDLLLIIGAWGSCGD